MASESSRRTSKKKIISALNAHTVRLRGAFPCRTRSAREHSGRLSQRGIDPAYGEARSPSRSRSRSASQQTASSPQIACDGAGLLARTDNQGGCHDGKQRSIERNIAGPRAYELYTQRGGEPGKDVEDWVRAEHDFRDLMDEVYDCGDYLLIKKRGEEDTVPLSNIINVNFSTFRRGERPRITLTLALPGKFGTEISFAPPPNISFPRRNQTAEDLLARAEKARSAHAG